MKLRFLYRREVTDALSQYQREVQSHRDGVNLMMQRDEAIKALRDQEPIVLCRAPMPNRPECLWEMRQGDYRCGACLTPNPQYIDRGLEPIRIRDIWGAV